MTLSRLQSADQVRSRALDTDWGRALRLHHLGRYILKNDDDVATAAEVREADHGEVTEVVEVGEALLEHTWLLYPMFTYYASLGSGGDFLSISLNGYISFYEDCKLAVPKSKACTKSHLDSLFVLINAPTSSKDA